MLWKFFGGDGQSYFLAMNMQVDLCMEWFLLNTDLCEEKAHASFIMMMGKHIDYETDFSKAI